MCPRCGYQCCVQSPFFGMLQCLHMLNDCFLLYVLFVEGASSSLSLSFLFFYVILGGSGNGYVVLG